MVHSLVTAFLLLIALPMLPGIGGQAAYGQAVGDSIKAEAVTAGLISAAGKQIVQPSDSGTTTQTLPGPQLEYDSANYDFGKVEMGTVIRHTFIYRNTGDEDLIIYFAKGGCTCVKVEYEKDTIAPGGIGEVTMVFDTSNRIGKEANTIYLQANTPQKIHRARFKGEIVWPEGKNPTMR